MKTEIQSNKPGNVKIKHGLTSVESAILIALIRRHWNEEIDTLYQIAPEFRQYPIRTAQQMNVDFMKEIKQYESEVRNG